jgi:hypothetical protein
VNCNPMIDVDQCSHPRPPRALASAGMASDPLAVCSRHKTVIFNDVLLGIFLKPGPRGRGAVIERLERDDDGSEREAEKTGTLKVDMALVRVDDIPVQHAEFGRVSRAVGAEPLGFQAVLIADY